MTSSLRSKVATWASLPACSTAATASMPYWPPSVRTASIDSSACSLDVIVEVTALSSVPSTCRFSTFPPAVSATAPHRSSSPTLPASWMTQRTLPKPSSLSRSPTARPAIVSLWPMWVIAPKSCHCS
jgi:hypothetical protein